MKLYRDRQNHNVLRTIFAILLVFYPIITQSDEPIVSWHMINVNSDYLQGDAHLLLSTDKSIMIDTGYYTEAREMVLPYLDNLGVKKIDHVFISHPHKDHYSGLLAFLEAGVIVSNLYIRTPPEAMCEQERPWGCDLDNIQTVIDLLRQSGTNIHTPSTGLSLTMSDDAKLQVVYAHQIGKDTDLVSVNDLSLVIKMYAGNKTVLFTGDLGRAIGNVLSADPEMGADILKMPHHGAHPIAPNAFFAKVAPKYIMVPSPEWVWCGERGTQARDWAAENDIPTWVSGIDGHVIVDFYKTKTTFSPEHASGRCKHGTFGSIVWIH